MGCDEIKSRADEPSVSSASRRVRSQMMKGMPTEDCSSSDEDEEDVQAKRRCDHLIFPLVVFWWSPVLVLYPRFEAVTAGVATAIGAFSVGLAAFALQNNCTAAFLRTVPPIVKCFVSGLLAGLGLLVMLPSALELRPPALPVTNLLLAFCAAPVAMYVVHHIILEHTHGPGAGACAPHMIQVKGKGPAALITSGATLKFNSMPKHCVPSKSPKPATKQPAQAQKADSRVREADERQRAVSDAALRLLELGPDSGTAEHRAVAID